MRAEYIAWLAHLYGEHLPPLRNLSMGRIQTILELRAQNARNAVLARKAAEEIKRKREEEKQIALLERLKREQP